MGPTPVVFPFRALWEFGGFARVLVPGTLVMVVGAAGGMKTAFIETITDRMRRQDKTHILWWGTEWTWEKMMDRAVQRYGGAGLDEMALHELHLHEVAQDMPQARRMGIPLTEKKYKASLEALDTIEAWPGISHMLEETITDVDALLAASHERIEELRNLGSDVRIACWDYAQLLDLYSSQPEHERLTTILGKLQVFCFEHQIIGITASQVTKSSQSLMKQERELLTAESGQSLRADKPKLILTLNPVFAEDGLITNEADIVVAKNNAGRTGKKRVYINPSKFQWLDTNEEPLPF